MSDLQALLDGIVHELNNPVNFVFGNTQRLEEELEHFQGMTLAMVSVDSDNSEVVSFFKQRFQGLFDCVSDLCEGSMRIRQVLNILRPLPYENASNWELTDLVPSIKSTLRMVSANFHDSVKFECDFRKIPPIYCNINQLKQVFTNLIVNGCQAITEKLQKNNDKKYGVFKVSTFQRDEDIGILFQDTGCGISQDVQERIFTPYFTTKKREGGTGLGLSISSEIIKAHQGKILVERRSEEGTSMIVYLPKKMTSGRA